MSNLPEFDEIAAKAQWLTMYEESERTGTGLSAITLARWQFDQCKARIALVEEQLACVLVNHGKIEYELNLIKAERNMLASGKLNCADCGAILARF